MMTSKQLSTTASQSFPIQPIYLFDDVARFQKNRIVDYLDQQKRFNLNDMIIMPFSDEDWIQFHQLTGCSVCYLFDAINNLSQTAIGAEIQKKEVAAKRATGKYKLFPDQPLIDDHGERCFRKNQIVRFLWDVHLVDKKPLDLDIFPIPDLIQLYQLLGYSVEQYLELGLVKGQPTVIRRIRRAMAKAK